MSKDEKIALLTRLSSVIDLENKLLAGRGKLDLSETTTLKIRLLRELFHPALQGQDREHDVDVTILAKEVYRKLTLNERQLGFRLAAVREVVDVVHAQRAADASDGVYSNRKNKKAPQI